jgi:hypothetical protein
MEMSVEFVRVIFHIMPSSPMPGRPATLTPSVFSPTAAMWLLSLSSGLQGGECCLCCKET